MYLAQELECMGLNPILSFYLPKKLQKSKTRVSVASQKD